MWHFNWHGKIYPTMCVDMCYSLIRSLKVIANGVIELVMRVMFQNI